MGSNSLLQASGELLFQAWMRLHPRKCPRVSDLLPCMHSLLLDLSFSCNRNYLRAMISIDCASCQERWFMVDGRTNSASPFLLFLLSAKASSLLASRRYLIVELLAFVNAQNHTHFFSAKEKPFTTYTRYARHIVYLCSQLDQRNTRDSRALSMRTYCSAKAWRIRYSN